METGNRVDEKYKRILDCKEDKRERKWKDGMKGTFEKVCCFSGHRDPGEKHQGGGEIASAGQLSLWGSSSGCYESQGQALVERVERVELVGGGGGRI